MRIGELKVQGLETDGLNILLHWVRSAQANLIHGTAEDVGFRGRRRSGRGSCLGYDLTYDLMLYERA